MVSRLASKSIPGAVFFFAVQMQSTETTDSQLWFPLQHSVDRSLNGEKKTATRDLHDGTLLHVI